MRNWSLKASAYAEGPGEITTNLINVKLNNKVILGTSKVKQLYFT